MLLFDLLALCVALAGLAPSARAWPFHRPDWSRRNLRTIERIYNLTVYPNQLPILAEGGAAVPPGLFNANATGRVDPVGNFSGFEDSIEYFFALAPVPTASSTHAAITSFRITEFSTACAGVAASVVYLFCSVVNPGAPDDGTALAPLKQVSTTAASPDVSDPPVQVAFWKFDHRGAVLKYDAWIPNLNAWVEASMGVDVTNPEFQAGSIEGLCDLTQVRCNGTNTQWSSVDQCVSTLSQKPYGNYDEAWGDNIVCRSIHLVLTQVRPEVSFRRVTCTLVPPLPQFSPSSLSVRANARETRRSTAPMSGRPAAGNASTFRRRSNTSSTSPCTTIQRAKRSCAGSDATPCILIREGDVRNIAGKRIGY